jgi:hypothetical protein
MVGEGDVTHPSERMIEPDGISAVEQGTVGQDRGEDGRRGGY